MDTDFLLYELKRRWWPLCSPQPNMFNLMSNCCSWVSKFQQPVRKVTVLMVGLDNAGKTSTLRGILKVPPRELGPTHGCVRTELRVDNFVVTVVDVGGSPVDRGGWREYCGEAHGIIFVVDSSDEQRLPEAKELLVDMLKQPRVARKPLLVLANKQDRMDALLVSELIEGLSLETLVNQSRTLCHIEPCSALVDLRRWSDRKTLRGLRWLLHAICLDYSDLCSRVARDSRNPPAAREDKGPQGKAEKTRGKSKDENTLRKKLKMKKKQVKIKDTMDSGVLIPGGEGGDEPEAGQKEDGASDALLPKNRGKTQRKSRRATKEGTEALERQRNEESEPKKEKKKKKKVVKVKKKNKINSEGIPAAYSQPVDLSATFDLYRKAILSLKARQEKEN
ncbi:ADP-ribosylation factor-like protein 13B [Arapaima gigas]